jgi:hypothetical protein
MPGRTSDFWLTRQQQLVDLAGAAIARSRNGRLTAADWVMIGRQIGATGDACRVKYGTLLRFGLAQAPPPPEPPTIVMPPPETAEERRARLREHRQLREQLQAVEGEHSLRGYLERLVQSVAQEFRVPPAPKPKKLAAHGSEESLLLIFSDWHAYEAVQAEAIRGWNQYDANVFGQRVRRVVDTTIDIARRMERGGWQFPELVVSLLGDFVSGTIHEVERHTDAPSIVHAVYGCAMVLAQALTDLSAAFPQLRVFVSPGNHGRLPDARKVQQKDPWRSWDVLIALLAREHLRGNSRITWHIPQSWSVAYEVQGWRFLQLHGHDVKSWMGIPFYGLNRMISTVGALEASRGSPVHYVLAGHFHTQSSLAHPVGEMFVNGSLIGATEFSVNALGRADKPTQWLLGVHREHGVTHRWPILCDGGTESYEVTPWRAA